jgi:putative endonuclease
MSHVSGKPYFVYVLWSASCHRFYIGISEDPRHRLAQHNFSGRGWSTRDAPWELVYTEEHPDYRSARLRERELKAQKGGRGFFQKTGLDPEQFRSLGS